MERLAAGTLSIIAAALIVGILGSIVPEKNGSGTLVRILCGLFLAFHMVSLFGNLDFGVIATFSENCIIAGDLAADRGKEMASEAVAERIKAEAESYILDKAQALGADLDVSVTVSGDEIPAPESVQLQGNISPYARIKLQQMMEQELGIPKEKQQWSE